MSVVLIGGLFAIGCSSGGSSSSGAKTTKKTTGTPSPKTTPTQAAAVEGKITITDIAGVEVKKGEEKEFDIKIARDKFGDEVVLAFDYDKTKLELPEAKIEKGKDEIKVKVKGKEAGEHEVKIKASGKDVKDAMGSVKVKVTE
jgi:hypothetical protein